MTGKVWPVFRSEKLDDHEILKDFDQNYQMTTEFLKSTDDMEWHIFEWYLKGIEVCQDFDLRHKEGRKDDNSNP